jgi:hypothetical protein
LRFSSFYLQINNHFRIAACSKMPAWNFFKGSSSNE